jgi:hypothetical protein
MDAIGLLALGLALRFAFRGDIESLGGPEAVVPLLWAAVTGIQGILFSLIFPPAAAWAAARVFNWVAAWPGGVPIHFRRPVDWEPGARELTHVGLRSALPVALIPALGMTPMVVIGSMATLIQPLLSGASAKPGQALAVLLVSAVPAVLSSLATAAYIVAYNLLARLTGGIAFRLTPLKEPLGEEPGSTPITPERRPRVKAIGWWQCGLVFAMAAPVVKLVELLVRFIIAGPIAWAGLAYQLMGALAALPGIASGLVAAATAGFIAGAIAALMYNAIGLLTGGVEIETRG